MEEVRDLNNNVIMFTEEEMEYRRMLCELGSPVWEDIMHPSDLEKLQNGEDEPSDPSAPKEKSSLLKLTEYLWPLVEAYRKRPPIPKSGRLPNGLVCHYYDRFY